MNKKQLSKRELQHLNRLKNDKISQDEYIKMKAKRFAEDKELLNVDEDMNIPNESDIKANLDSSLIDKFNEQTSTQESIKELFSDKNIKLKTQVTTEQRIIISQLYDAYKEFLRLGIDVKALRNFLEQFIIFGVPMERKSREEFVSGLQQQNTNQFGNPFLNLQSNNPMVNNMRR